MNSLVEAGMTDFKISLEQESQVNGHFWRCCDLGSPPL
jgi:hypothetical protein